MHIFQKNVVSLWRAFASHWYKHCWKEKTLEVYWVSKTAKIRSPRIQTASVRAYRHGLLSLEGQGAWRCQDTTVMGEAVLFV